MVLLKYKVLHYLFDGRIGFYSYQVIKQPLDSQWMRFPYKIFLRPFSYNLINEQRYHYLNAQYTC